MAAAAARAMSAPTIGLPSATWRCAPGCAAVEGGTDRERGEHRARPARRVEIATARRRRPHRAPSGWGTAPAAPRRKRRWSGRPAPFRPEHTQRVALRADHSLPGAQAPAAISVDGGDSVAPAPRGPLREVMWVTRTAGPTANADPVEPCLARRAHAAGHPRHARTASTSRHAATSAPVTLTMVANDHIISAGSTCAG